jgi:hypothetical protein
VGRAHKLPEVRRDNCACELENFECDFNYVRDPKDVTSCVAAFTESPPAGACLNGEKTFRGSSGWRRVPGDTCSGGLVKDAQIEKQCPSSTSPIDPTLPGQISRKAMDFSNTISAHHFLPNTTTILIRDVSGTVWRSDDEGGVWATIQLPGEGASTSVTHVRLHDHDSNRVWFMSFALICSGVFIYVKQQTLLFVRQS